MVQIGETCKKLEKQIYWTEFPAHRHQFFKIMIGDFRNQLRIPRKFARNFKQKLSSTIRLRGPSKNVWKVQIAEAIDDVLFLSGWGNFVRVHNLAERDFLVFCYNGNSSFNVAIFDDTGCERETAYFVKKHTLCSNNGCFLQKKETSACSNNSCLLQTKQNTLCSNNGCFPQKKDPKNVEITLDGVGEKVQQKKQKVESGNLRKKMQERNLESGIEHKTSKVDGTNHMDKNSNKAYKNGIRSAGAVGSKQVVILDLEDDENKRRCLSRKQRRFVEEDESNKSCEEFQVRLTAMSQKKKRRIQNNVQHGVSKRFQSTDREGLKESRKKWNDKKQLTVKKDKMVVTQKTPEVLDLTRSISKQGRRKKDKMEVIYIS